MPHFSFPGLTEGGDLVRQWEREFEQAQLKSSRAREFRRVRGRERQRASELEFDVETRDFCCALARLSGLVEAAV
jgi:hypothetical protein